MCACIIRITHRFSSFTHTHQIPQPISGIIQLNIFKSTAILVTFYYFYFLYIRLYISIQKYAFARCRLLQKIRHHEIPLKNSLTRFFYIIYVLNIIMVYSVSCIAPICSSFYFLSCSYYVMNFIIYMRLYKIKYVNNKKKLAHLFKFHS